MNPPSSAQDGDALVRNDDALALGVIEPLVGGAVAGGEGRVFQHELAEAHLEGHDGQEFGNDLALLVVQVEILELPSTSRWIAL